MRSRYSAFVLRNEQYLLKTWHASTRPKRIVFDPGQTWIGLRILTTETLGPTAAVEFVARYRLGGGPAQRLHERSRFVLEAGRWMYIDGEVRR